LVRRLGSDHRHSALLRYGLLVLVPAVVFGGLLWNRLLAQHAARRAQVPESVIDASGRLARAVRQELEGQLELEEGRPFYVYQENDYFEQSTVPGELGFDLRPVKTPLEPTPGIRAWYQYDVYGLEDVEPTVIAPQPRGLTVTEAEAHTAWRLDFPDFVDEVLIRELVETNAHLIAQAEVDLLLDSEWTRSVLTPIELVALNCAMDRDPKCTGPNLHELRKQIGGELRSLRVRYGPFQVRALRDHLGELRVIAERFVVIDPLPDPIQAPQCFTMIEKIQALAQGIDIDPDWLLRRLPAAHAAHILEHGIELHAAGAEAPVGEDVTAETLDLWDVYDVDLPSPEERPLGHLTLSSGVAELDDEIRTQLAWLTGVTGAMIASLVLGMRLLLGSVRASQEQARRTENFVAAVTHELRTPIAGVKMYGEMLRDGWARDEERRRDYLERIVRESDRLDVLVDRVLAHRMLQDHAPRPEPGDLSALVANLASDLRTVAGEEHDDVEFALAPDLPSVLLHEEGVRDVLVNLIENARKYAPVPAGGEPIRVESHLDRKGRVVLEVSDRGPGIPEEERGKVFEPFYRLGDESTRASRGTGLGLHLVQLQARAMKARAQLRPREGGGCRFRVTFRTLRPGAIG